MLDIQDLLQSHAQASERVNEIIQKLHLLKLTPDIDTTVVKQTYQIYLISKQKFEDIDIQYKTYIKTHGLSIHG